MADDYGSTTTAGNVGTVTLGGSTTGSLEVGGDHDWFRITLVAGQSYIFNLDRNTLSDPFLVLRDQNGVDIVGNDDIVTNVNFNSQIRFTATVSGTYYLDAFSSDGTATGTYTLRAAIDPSPPASTDDYGAQAGSPNVGTIAVGGTATGNLEAVSDRDWFAITLIAGTSYTFRQEGITLADPFLRLRDGNGVQITGNDDFGGTLNSQITYTAATTGVYYLEANTADAGQPAGIGTYRVTAAVNGNPPPAPTDDFGSQAGAGNLGSVALGGSSTGLINYGGDHDWFAVTLSTGSIYRIRQETGTLVDPRFSLRNSIGVVVSGDDDSGGGQNAQVDFTAAAGGTYYIDANSADGNDTGTYTVRLTLVYGAPVIVNNTGSSAFEGGSDTITASELSTTDPDTAATAIVYTLTSLATNGSLTRGGSAIALNGTFTQADINANLIAYAHNGSETTSGSFGFSVSDGTTNFTGRTFNVAVTLVNDAPTLTGLSGDTVTTTEPAGTGSVLPGVRIDAGANAAVADVDNANFGGGSIRFAITAGLVAAQDQLAIDTSAATTVTIGAGIVSVGGIAIGSVTGGGAGGGDLVVALSTAATPARVQTLIQAVQFINTGGDTPTAGARTITVTLNDGGGTANGGTSTVVATSTVTVVAVDDAPAPVADTFTVSASGTTVVAPLANDTDPDGGPIAIGTFGGFAAVVGSPFTLGLGGRITPNANGTLTFDANGQFDYLISTALAAQTGASNTSVTDGVSYSLTPGGAGSNLAFVINGVDGAGDELRGTVGIDTITGTSNADIIRSFGGNDFVLGNDGDDNIDAGDGDDTVRGGIGNDVIVGGLGRDLISGGDGNDTLDGGTGLANELGGGIGNDLFIVGAVGDTILEGVNEGTDTVQTALGLFALPANVENLTYTGAGAFIGIGNGLDNTITHLTGSAGELQGGAGNDTYFTNVVGDSIIEAANGGTDTILTSLGFYRLGGNVENLTYSGAGAFIGIGNELDNMITHNSGSAAEIQGGTGNDTYVIGVAGDSLIEAANGGNDTVQTALASFTLGANIENLIYTGGGSFTGTGNALDNLFTGGTGRDTFVGGAGNDAFNGGSGTANDLIGGLGDDTYNVAVAGDTVTELANEGTDIVLTSLANYTLAANVENLTFTGGAAFNGVGNAGDNAIIGGGAADILSGLNGNDVLTGGSGADLLIGGAGNDTFRYLGGETGLDRIIDFTAGSDRISLAAAGFTQTGTLTFQTGTAATTANSTFLYDTNSGIVSYDADGSGAGAAIQLAQLNTGLTLTIADFAIV